MRPPSPTPTLRPVRVEDYVPPIHPWILWCGLVLVGGFGVAIALAAVLRYNLTVNAAAIVRPAGDVRLVQAEREGTIERIEVQTNQTVQRGEVIAQLNGDRLEAQREQLQSTLQQTQMQLAQMAAQIQFLEAQITAEQRSRDQSIAIAQAQLRRDQRDYRERQTTTQADLREAEAALELAQNEQRRYEQLVADGVVSQLQVEEKQAAVRTAAAQVERAQATLNPSDAPVAIAQEQIGQQVAVGASTLANLNRERESLVQLRGQLQNQFLREQYDLRLVEAELAQTVIRASSDGVILRLNLRNPNQVVQAGDILAEIAPRHAALVVKARVRPQDINRIAVGQVAQMRVSACPYPDYGLLAGEVTAVSPDAIAPQANSSNPGPSYYEVTIQPGAPVLRRGDRTCPLQPGMDADATIISQQETPLMFLLRRARLWVGL